MSSTSPSLKSTIDSLKQHFKALEETLPLVVSDMFLFTYKNVRFLLFLETQFVLYDIYIYILYAVSLRS